MDAETEERTDSKQGQSDQKASMMVVGLCAVLVYRGHFSSPMTNPALLLLIYTFSYWIPPRDPKGFWHYAVRGCLLWGVLIPLKLGPPLLRDAPMYLAYGVPCLLAFLVFFFALKYLNREITPLQGGVISLVMVIVAGVVLL